MGLAAEKAALRRQMRVLRDELAARAPDAGEEIAARFPMKLFERYGPVVSGYWPIGSEIDARPLMQRLQAEGAELCLPRVGDEGTGITFHAWAPGDPLEARPFGLSEPLASAPQLKPSLLLVPLLAFDPAGHRLGHGKGYYDRALAELRAAGPAFACALAFAGQQVDSVPAGSHDEPLDWAMTEAGSVPLFMARALAGRQSGHGPGTD